MTYSHGGETLIPEVRDKGYTPRTMPPPTDVRTERPKRVLVVDDHALMRRGLTIILAKESDLLVCGEASGMSDCLAQAAKLRPDLCIVDLRLKDGNGLDLVRLLRKGRLSRRILVVSMHEEAAYVEGSLRAGADGYLTKGSTPNDLIAAVRAVLAGRLFADDAARESLAGHMFEQRPGAGGLPVQRLSPRELEVFGLIGDGHGTREIARIMGVGSKTLETYRSSIRRKLNLAGGSALLREAIHWRRTSSPGRSPGKAR